MVIRSSNESVEVNPGSDVSAGRMTERLVVSGVDFNSRMMPWLGGVHKTAREGFSEKKP